MFTSSNYGKRSFSATDTKSLCEDWDTPSRIMELQEALENYTAVWFELWPIDPSPHIIRRVLLYTNWGAQAGEDEKGRIRYRYLSNNHAKQLTNQNYKSIATNQSVLNNAYYCPARSKDLLEINLI